MFHYLWRKSIFVAGILLRSPASPIHRNTETRFMSSVLATDSVVDRSPVQIEIQLPTKRRKPTAGSIAGRVVARAVSPKRLWNAVKLQRNRKAHRHSYDDAQLALYAQILPTGFLHFGYFDDVT